MILALALSLHGLAAHAAPTKVFCQVAHSELASSDQMRPGTTYTFELSEMDGEGVGHPRDLGAIGPVNMSLTVYYSDLAEHQLTLQLDERLDGDASEMLAATLLAPHGPSQLSYRAPGGTHLIFVGCGLVTDDQLTALEKRAR